MLEKHFQLPITPQVSVAQQPGIPHE
jgi:hypothetical protein